MLSVDNFPYAATDTGTISTRLVLKKAPSDTKKMFFFGHCHQTEHAEAQVGPRHHRVRSRLHSDKTEPEKTYHRTVSNFRENGNNSLYATQH